ncbi:hypothetical protein HETIRDRAFT_448227 [Heterobasidion irregulare TC 32-1]|uniref:FYVE-type domain-containing protein n=1 Tax=Heterobasidion irregulare (strain TC 32-1) TaxID=747525 RepID=W4KPU4_HETIT|nr:uncharacterized protein HETIRDRAFT_448227 [Heterobasidion irregulare TC 32-1]ETW87812.1 hypothetical protein HETIRDRAFT_448227 [Heterobasidion irregulare TC 32-1]
MSPASPASLPAAIAWLTGSRLVPRSSPSSSSLPSLSDDASSATSSSPSSTPPSALASLASLQAADATPIRPNEHLAVFLPKTHWKSDSQASYCETFLCHKKFSVFERRHHCRKCGGIFCHNCSSRTTALLDTSTLSFLYPPRNVSIFTYASPESPVSDSRVCDACYDIIYACPTPRSPPVIKPALPAPISVRTSPVRSRNSSTSRSSSVLLTPPDGQTLPPAIRRRPAPRRHMTLPAVPNPPSEPEIYLPQAPVPTNDLDAYPLRIKSEVCKRNGGGRWTPKRLPVDVAARVAGRKAVYELEMEREEEEIRRERLNPVIKDGDFQYRAPREFQPSSPGGPYVLSTF